MTLGAGLYPVPEGHLAAVVTHLEMTAPTLAPPNFPDGVTATQERMTTDDYRALFRAIGEKWLWISRLKYSDTALRTVLEDPNVETTVIRRGDQAIGLVELDYRQPDSCEVAFFGMLPSETGRGLGKPMMALAQKRAFMQSIKTLHLHTCTLDSPHALEFYQACGFNPVRREIEVLEDPRLGGYVPEGTAPNHPLIR